MGLRKRERVRLEEKRKNTERVTKGERDEVSRIELGVREKKGNERGIKRKKREGKNERRRERGDKN